MPTLRDDMTRDFYVDTVAGETVQRYRPRIEGGFARIERRERTADGDVYWTATTPDNTTSIYGRSTEARIADPGDARRVFTWLLEETRDDKGNVLQYKYKAEDLVNVPKTAPFEANRHKGAAPVTNRYLKRIRYGNTTPSDTSPELDSALFEVVFDYGEHDATAPTLDEAQLWPCRQDPFSTYRAGFRDPHLSALPPRAHVPSHGRTRGDAVPRSLHRFHPRGSADTHTPRRGHAGRVSP